MLKPQEISYEDLLTFRTTGLKTLKPNQKQRTITTENPELAYLGRIFNIALRQEWIAKNPFNRGESLIEVSAERLLFSGPIDSKVVKDGIDPPTREFSV